MMGNLLCISDRGDFKSPIWAVVGRRDGDDTKKNQPLMIELLSEVSQYFFLRIELNFPIPGKRDGDA